MGKVKIPLRYMPSGEIVEVRLMTEGDTYFKKKVDAADKKGLKQLFFDDLKDQGVDLMRLKGKSGWWSE